MLSNRDLFRAAKKPQPSFTDRVATVSLLVVPARPGQVCGFQTSPNTQRSGSAAEMGNDFGSRLGAGPSSSIHFE